MKCPYCESEMEEVYLQSAQQIYLNRKHPRIFASGDLKTRTLSRFSLIKAPFVKAYHCEDCEKIIIDLKEPKKNETSTRKRSLKR